MKLNQSTRSSFAKFVVLLTCFALSEAFAFPGRMFDVRKFHPTQFTVGKQEVAIRKVGLEERLESGGEKALDKYLKKKPAQVVLGPDNSTYIINGHHLACTLLEMGRNRLYAEIAQDWSDLSPTDFMARMEKNHFFYLFDQTGAARKSSELPVRLTDLKDDPYRTLAWLVRKVGGFDETSEAFQEFIWADFFRTRVTLHSADSTGYKKAVHDALDAARTSAAAKLPGAWNVDQHATSVDDDLADLLDALDRRGRHAPRRE